MEYTPILDRFEKYTCVSCEQDFDKGPLEVGVFEFYTCNQFWRTLSNELPCASRIVCGDCAPAEGELDEADKCCFTCSGVRKPWLHWMTFNEPYNQEARRILGAVATRNSSFAVVGYLASHPSELLSSQDVNQYGIVECMTVKERQAREWVDAQKFFAEPSRALWEALSEESREDLAGLAGDIHGASDFIRSVAPSAVDSVAPPAPTSQAAWEKSLPHLTYVEGTGDTYRTATYHLEGTDRFFGLGPNHGKVKPHWPDCMADPDWCQVTFGRRSAPVWLRGEDISVKIKTVVDGRTSYLYAEDIAQPAAGVGTAERTGGEVGADSTRGKPRKPPTDPERSLRHAGTDSRTLNEARGRSEYGHSSGEAALSRSEYGHSSGEAALSRSEYGHSSGDATDGELLHHAMRKHLAENPGKEMAWVLIESTLFAFKDGADFDAVYGKAHRAGLSAGIPNGAITFHSDGAKASLSGVPEGMKDTVKNALRGLCQAVRFEAPSRGR
ncbi:hypothetical protein AB0N09_36140 [Streptomyces erythrochromogenes]|uniref:hypothetical protein n=1 Tax=Streptomyces erythrochromogenes TaxID=285574 RepID=UPI003439A5F0